MPDVDKNYGVSLVLDFVTCDVTWKRSIRFSDDTGYIKLGVSKDSAECEGADKLKVWCFIFY